MRQRRRSPSPRYGGEKVVCKANRMRGQNRLYPESLSASAQNPSGIILAVSGGPDSIAMMRLFAWLRDEFAGLPAIVASVDHGLRPESAEEVKRVAAWAKEQGLAFRALRWSGEKPAAGIQAAAREARYGLLTGLARRIGATHLLTAHTQDDQAETILMRLLRGSGPAGLAGMQRLSGRDGIAHLRPLLDVPKARLLELCRAASWRYFDDISNRDAKFTRARLRKIMAALAPEGLSAKRLAALGRRLGLAEAALDETARAALDGAAAGSTDAYHANSFYAAAPDIRRRMLALAIARAVASGPGGPPVRLERLESLAAKLAAPAAAGASPRRFSLGGAIIALNHCGMLVFTAEQPRRRGRLRQAQAEAQVTLVKTLAGLDLGKSAQGT